MRHLSFLFLLLSTFLIFGQAFASKYRDRADHAPPLKIANDATRTVPQSGGECRTNAECLKAGQPIRKPTRRRSLRSRGDLTAPTPSASPAVRFSAVGSGAIGAIQTFTPATDGYYFIQAVGASGGNSANSPTNIIGGRGGLTEASIYLLRGQTISIVVGNQGGTSASGSGLGGGGGGGTFIYINNQALVVAGGGGGARWRTANGGDASTAADGSGNRGGGDNPGGGGTNGNGGTQGTGGGGGAGFSSAGAAGTIQGGQGGQSAATWTGGLGGNGQTAISGGYGGGGGASDGNGFSGGGGGGGYSGGGGGSSGVSADSGVTSGSGGGGGAYIVPTAFNGKPILNTRRDVYDNRGSGFVLIRRQ